MKCGMKVLLGQRQGEIAAVDGNNETCLVQFWKGTLLVEVSGWLSWSSLTVVTDSNSFSIPF